MPLVSNRRSLHLLQVLGRSQRCPNAAHRRRCAAAVQTPACPLLTALCRVPARAGHPPRGPLQPATTQRTRSSQQRMATARRGSHQQRSMVWRWQQASQQARRLMHSPLRPRPAVAALLQSERLRMQGCCWTMSTSLSSAASCRILRCVTRADFEIACCRVQYGVGMSGQTASLAHDASRTLVVGTTEGLSVGTTEDPRGQMGFQHVRYKCNAGPAAA